MIQVSTVLILHIQLDITGCRITRNHRRSKEQYLRILCLLYTSVILQVAFNRYLYIRLHSHQDLQLQICQIHSVTGGHHGRFQAAHLHIRTNLIIFTDSSLSVSYTHLDVYKRQPPYLSYPSSHRNSLHTSCSYFLMPLSFRSIIHFRTDSGKTFI